MRSFDYTQDGACSFEYISIFDLLPILQNPLPHPRDHGVRGHIFLGLQPQVQEMVYPACALGWWRR